MSKTNNNELIILAITRNDNDIIVRIDKNGLAHSQFEGLPVTELKLMGCQGAARLFDGESDYVNEPLDLVLDELTSSIDKPLNYEIQKEADAFIIFLQVNYSPNELRLNCTKISETPSDYIVEELKSKTNRLARLYHASIEASELSYYMYHLLKDALQKMIVKELELHKRKIEFFSGTNPEKAATLKGEVQAYQEILTLIGLGEVNGKAIAPQISGSILQIWSDNVWHQATYAALVESRIADMGKAALFPLLEFIKHTNSWYMREEAMLILGLIDPEVKEKVMKIAHSDNKPAYR